MDISKILPGGELDSSKLNIGFLLGGGMGDYLIFFNYLYHFCNYFKKDNIHIETIFDSGKNIANVFLVEGELTDAILTHPKTTEYFKNYDLFIQLSRYPHIKIKKMDKIKIFSPKLLDYILACEKFEIINPRYFNGYKLDGQSAAYSELLGIKRIQQPDIYGLLKIDEKYEYKLPYNPFGIKYINDLGLISKEYITLHRGCDIRYAKNSTKLWPLDYYNSLVKIMKITYPDLKIVQLGVSHERCGDIDGVDLNLVGKTSIAQVSSLLNYSKLHIDNEGGMIHLRHALNTGQSIVLFGPTSKNFFGYSENYNIRGAGCAHWCEWISDNWMHKCLQGYSEPPCMLSIVPSMVMEKVNDALR